MPVPVRRGFQGQRSALVRQASEDELARRIGRAAAKKIRAYYDSEREPISR